MPSTDVERRAIRQISITGCSDALLQLTMPSRITLMMETG